MSESSQYYHRSSHSHSHRDDTSLPSIRDVVGDELEGRVRPNPHMFGDVRGALPALRHTQTSREALTGPILPLIVPSSHSGREYREGWTTSAANHAWEYRETRPDRHSTSGYPEMLAVHVTHNHSAPDVYREHGGAGELGYIPHGVLRPSLTAAGYMIHGAPPGSRPHNIHRQFTTIPRDQNPVRRHRCDYCGRGFDRPSNLEEHLRTHTGAQSFVCEWPGCNRTFSVRSSMLRHLRAHQSSSSSSSRRYHSDSLPQDASSHHYYSSSPRYYASR